MTLEYRCSKCGELLQTTNADPLGAEIERLRAHIEALQGKIGQHDCACSYDNPDDVCMPHSPIVDSLRAEIERLRAYVIHERSLGAEEPMLELTQARQEIEQLRSKVEKWQTAYAMCDRSRDAFAVEIEKLRAENDEWSHRAKTAEARLSKQNVEIERLRAERDDWRKRAFAGMPSAE